MPGRGPSSPIVVRGRVFVTASAGPRQDRLMVLCFDAASGRQLWRREFWATGRTLTHPMSSVAAPTPASDGTRIFAFYSSNDLVCLDLEGNLCWYRGLAYDYPKAGNDAGMASSPAVADETVVVQVENQGDSFAIGIDTGCGETRWRIPRDPVGNWSSPIVLPEERPGGGRTILLQAPSGLTAVDARTGEKLWQCPLACAAIPSSAAWNGRICVPAGGLTAIGWSAASGAPAVVWECKRISPNASSPVVDGGRVYAINGAGVLGCAEADSGKLLWQVRLGGKHWSTPVICGKRMYCISEDGKARVVDLSARGQLMGTSDFGETVLCSPAAAEGALYVRSDRYLWKIAHRATTAP